MGEFKLEVKDYFFLGAILCSTDTVAALSLVNAERYPNLNAWIFGEAIFNDAVSIVLFRAVKNIFS